MEFNIEKKEAIVIAGVISVFFFCIDSIMQYVSLAMTPLMVNVGLPPRAIAIFHSIWHIGVILAFYFFALDAGGLDGFELAKIPSKWGGVAAILFLLIIGFAGTVFESCELELDYQRTPIDSAYDLTISYDLSIAGPVMEELVCRGIILPVLLKAFEPDDAIIYAGVIFSVIHLQETVILAETIPKLLGVKAMKQLSGRVYSLVTGSPVVDFPVSTRDRLNFYSSAYSNIVLRSSFGIAAGAAAIASNQLLPPILMHIVWNVCLTNQLCLKTLNLYKRSNRKSRF